MKCRHCNTELKYVFVDLINCPPSNSMLKQEQLNEPEVYYPLKIYTCHNCHLVQVDETKKASEIFDSEYTYFSSFSKSWLEHAKKYVDLMMDRFHYDTNSQVIEIASNDGYLLQYFKEYYVPVLGVDPTANTAAVAIDKGIPTIIDFFGAQFAQEQLVNKGMKGDLILGNNVLAHVPDINDFVKGMKTALKSTGTITMEFPHLMRLVEECQFDTIYHEHFSYLSFTTVKRIFENQGLEMFDVQELSTHGGSLRIFAKHKDDKSKEISKNVQDLLDREEKAGMKEMDYYNNFKSHVDTIKYNVWEFLINAKKEGKKVIGYGAAAKGNTLLNYCGIKGNDLIEFAVDASPHKQNKFLPASHIPVKDLDSIAAGKPDYVIILPWNLKKEISEQLNYIKDWGGKFVTFIPELNIF
jgi:SAM-dependent methyltransferase